MLFGILPFLVQWLALNSNSHGSNMGYISNYNYPHQPKSHWTLLTELQQLPEDEIEQFLPQICNILFDVETCGASRGDNTGRELSHYLEDILIQKCQDSLPFGLKLCGLLKVINHHHNIVVIIFIYPSHQSRLRRYHLLKASSRASFPDQIALHSDEKKSFDFFNNV